MNLTPYELLLNTLTKQPAATLRGQLHPDEMNNLLQRVDNVQVTYDSARDTTRVYQPEYDFTEESD